MHMFVTQAHVCCICICVCQAHVWYMCVCVHAHACVVYACVLYMHVCCRHMFVALNVLKTASQNLQLHLSKMKIIFNSNGIHFELGLNADYTLFLKNSQ